jgi:hypothetical protein
MITAQPAQMAMMVRREIGDEVIEGVGDKVKNP